MGRLSVLCIHHMVVCCRDVRTELVVNKVSSVFATTD